MNRRAPYNPNRHKRQSIRMKGYDYSQSGLYFITICVKNRLCLFGEVVNKKMILNDAGKMVEKEWLKLPQRFQNIKLHEFVVMPNHFHSIIEIVGATLVVAPNVANDVVAPNVANDVVAPNVANNVVAPTIKTKTIGEMVGAFQSIVTVEYIQGVKQQGWPKFNGKLWQRNYYEHIIRDKKSYIRISKYIVHNPKKWNDDWLLG